MDKRYHDDDWEKRSDSYLDDDWGNPFGSYRNDDWERPLGSNRNDDWDKPTDSYRDDDWGNPFGSYQRDDADDWKEPYRESDRSYRTESRYEDDRSRRYSDAHREDSRSRHSDSHREDSKSRHSDTHREEGKNHRSDAHRETRGKKEKRPVRNAAKPKKPSPLSNPMIYLLFICAVSAVLAVVGWSMANDMLALNKEEATAVVCVKDEKDFGSVVDQLKEGGIIRYKGLFRLFSAFTHGQDKISDGTYELNTNMDYRAILSSLGRSSANRMEVEVTIPEGMSVRQIFQLLEKNGVSTVEKLEDMAATHDYAFSFLQSIPLGEPTRLEGYLFPDTYKFFAGEDPKYVINKMLVNFDAKVNDSIRQQIWAKGLDVNYILTVASMIEKETDGSDRTLISSVIYNRLNTNVTAGYLQIDATIQYVLPEGEIVSEEDYETVDSPYNTYLHKGLPPGPISNPGMTSIMAALNPERTNYYYYALGTDKVHHFFSSYSEFQHFVYG